MPKVTVHGGASNADALDSESTESWDGNNSEKSETTTEQTQSESEANGQPDAQTTESRSETGQTKTSTARPAAGMRQHRRRSV